MENSAVRWIVIGLLIVLVVPLLAMLGMMATGVIAGSGMMSQMQGMMGGYGMGMMNHGAMVLCATWLAIVAAALVLLIVLLTRNPKPPVDRQKAA